MPIGPGSAARTSAGQASLGLLRVPGRCHRIAATSAGDRCIQVWPNSKPASWPLSHTSSPAAAVVARPQPSSRCSVSLTRGSGTCRPLGGTGGQGSRHILTTSGPASIRAALLLEESAVLVRMRSDQASNRRETGLPEPGFPVGVEHAEPRPRRALADPLPLPHTQQLGGVLPTPPIRRLRALALMDLAVGREATVRTLVEGVRRPLLAAVRAGLAHLSNDGERVATITLHLGVSPSGVRPRAGCVLPGRSRSGGHFTDGRRSTRAAPR